MSLAPPRKPAAVPSGDEDVEFNVPIYCPSRSLSSTSGVGASTAQDRITFGSASLSLLIRLMTPSKRPPGPLRASYSHERAVAPSGNFRCASASAGIVQVNVPAFAGGGGVSAKADVVTLNPSTETQTASLNGEIESIVIPPEEANDVGTNEVPLTPVWQAVIRDVDPIGCLHATVLPAPQKCVSGPTLPTPATR
ncbi:protein of unknown function [Candidatus Filomicrobium marinum]|uniref:Uncharacterized protein n=1 Tax=Candidatus Filomicrobium marinum TaxID=1608628 RepID=A0A0D6JJ95_9HYPH|nr:protein of unknown function [Candidatus Filomicrobium marinum]CPR21782.1 protein of unknown function [Candidatus Filomicrobium marinum]